MFLLPLHVAQQLKATAHLTEVREAGSQEGRQTERTDSEITMEERGRGRGREFHMKAGRIKRDPE